MNKEQILSAFSKVNMQMVEFLDSKIPDNMDVKTMKTSLSTLIATNPILNIQTFVTCTVRRFRTEIENHDYSFFETFRNVKNKY